MRTVLVVDDSATIRLSLQTALALHHCKVETAEDGLVAVSRLEQGLRPDLIITDVHMPNLNGIDLIARVRAMPSLRFTPILVMTTESQQRLREEARHRGATGWLVKPVGGPELLNVLRKIFPEL